MKQTILSGINITDFIPKKNHRYGICGGHMGVPCGMRIPLWYTIWTLFSKEFCVVYHSQWCEENENPIPQWEEQNDSVIVTFLPSTPLLKAGIKEERQLESQPESQQGIQQEPRIGGGSLTAKVLSLIERKGPISRAFLLVS